MNSSKKPSRVVLLLKLVLALNLVMFGLNKFLFFLPDLEMAPAADVFFKQLFASGYLMQLTGAVEILAAIGLFFRRTAPIALVALVPISVNIVAFHLFLDPSTILPALVVASMNAVLIYLHWARFASLLMSN